MGRGEVTVACGAGFAGDRIEPAVDLASSGSVDWVGLECLAERTIVTGLVARGADAGQGYDPRLERRLRPLLPAAASTGCGVVTNLGSANPSAAGEAIAALCRQLDLDGTRIAVVTGDDVADRLGDVRWPGGAPEGGEWLGAHAYLGVGGIEEAIGAGAQVVVTGRVADSSLFAGAAATLALDEDGLAGALTAGHLLECGGQLTGGNLAAGTPQLDAGQLARLGYPLATVRSDGSSLVGVLPGRPARLDALTCTLQLLYEVHDPSCYLTPDLALDLTGVRFEQVAANTVLVTGARGAGRPVDLKVVGFYRSPGYVADVEITFAGSGALDRSRRAADVLRLRLAPLVHDWAVDLVGVDSVLGPTALSAGAAPSEVRVHTSAHCSSAELAQAVEDEVYALTLSGPAGGSALRSERRPRVSVVPGLISREHVSHAVEQVKA